ncbi:calponin homology domain-containing protein DDB_G0272472-like isoform X2 [Octopus sinensis]|uniref:Calponin homology domain-containing protein DDB_G0272472-like isoform X2 n=1 Tax=Octopus sinensis TaxID=2607531 RepID=A0A6P7SPG6_9MOLL|nr:calponin homology domain-containing protein DDB_G0272472-like isoform X2 [Octopus sinensis]
MKAVQCGHCDVVEVLLSYKVDAEARDSDGNTCLHLAVQYAHLEILDAMLNARTNANLKNMAGKTPLHYAVIEDKIKIAMSLLQNRADVNSIDNDHKTALMLACQVGNDNMVSLLLRFQAAVHVKDANGWTASDHALIKGYNACVQLLESYQKSQKLQFSEDSIDLDESPAASSRLKQSSHGLAKRRVSMSPAHQPVPIPKQSENMDDSAEETGTLSSHYSQTKDTGSDCWGDDTDISLTTDDKNNKGQMRVNLAKLVPKSSDSEDFDNLENPYSTIDISNRGNTFVPAKTFNDNEESIETGNNVPSKENNQITDILNTTSENFNTAAKEGTAEPIYATVNKTKKLTVEQQRGDKNGTAFMDELGLSDSDDLIDAPAPSPFDHKPTGNSGFDGGSDWDSVVADDASKTGDQQEQLFNEDLFAAFNERVQSKPQQNLFHSDTNYFGEKDESNGDCKQNKDLISHKPLITKNDWDSSCLSSPPNYDTNESNHHKNESNQPKSESNQHNSKDFLCQMSLNKESDSGDEDSDWDSPANSTNLPKTDVTGARLNTTTTNMTSIKVDQEEYLQRTSSLRRMSSAAKNLDMAASKIIACSSQPSDYLIESSGLYKNAYEEFVSSVGLVADMTPDLTAKTQIMEKLDSISDVSSRLLLVANAVSTDQTDHSAKNKLSGAARFVTECIDQLINVCSGIETEEEVEENNGGESQVNEGFLFVRDSQLSRSMGELRQSYLYEPDSDGNVVEEENSVEPFSKDKVDANMKNAAASVAKLSEETLFQMRKESLESTAVPLSVEKKKACIAGGSIETKDKCLGDSEEMKLVTTLEEPKLNETPKGIESTVLAAPSLQLTADIQQSIPQGKKPTETVLEDFAGFGFLDSSDVLKDDDMLSVTSFETENNLSTVNYEKDVLMNLNLNDPTSAAKLQQYINDCRQRLKKEKNQRTLIENQYRVLQEDNKNMQKKLQVVSQEKAALEQNKIGLEAKISDMKYKLAEESDKCKDEEILLGQCKKQQEKVEQLYRKECEDKQEVDHCLYQTQLELKWTKNSLQRLESENEELHSQRDQLMQGGGGKQSQTSHLYISQLTQTSESLPDQNFSVEMVQLKEENQKLREEMSELKMSRSQKQLSETVELHRVIEELQEGKKTAEMLTKDIQHQMELKENTSSLEKRQMNDNLKRLQEERDKREQDLVQVQGERDGLKHDLATYQERLKNMDRLHQLKINDQERLISQLRMELEKEQSTNRELQDCLSSAKKQISKLQNKEEEMKAVLAEQKHLLQENKYKRDNLQEETKEKLLSAEHAKERLESDLKTLQLQKSDLEIELRREKDKVKIFQRNFEKPQNDDKESLIHDLQIKDAQLQGKLEHEKHKSAMMQRLLDEHLAHPNANVSTVREEEKLQESTETVESLKMTTESKHRDIALEEEIKELRFQLKKEKEYWNKRLEQERKMMKSQLEKERHKVKLLQEKQINSDVKIEEEEEKNHLLQCEITALKSRTKPKDNMTGNHLSYSLPLQSDMVFDDRFNATDDFRYQRHPQLDKQLRIELSKKLEEVNHFLQQQHEQYEKLMTEKENRISADKNKLQSELHQMRLNYENALSTKSLQEQEALHFRELYLKELSRYQGAQPIFYGGYDPLWRFASLNYRIPEKSPLDLNSSILNSSSKFHARNASMNSTPSEVGQVNQEYNDVYGKLKEEMHRSIKRHLEAPPFDEQLSCDPTYMKMSPLTVLQGSAVKPLGLIELNNALSQSKADYLTLMKHKYCL